MARRRRCRQSPCREMTLMPALGECMRTTAARSSTRVSLSRRHPLALREAEEDDEGPVRTVLRSRRRGLLVSAAADRARHKSRPVPPNPSRGPRSVLHAVRELVLVPLAALLALVRLSQPFGRVMSRRTSARSRTGLVALAPAFERRIHPWFHLARDDGQRPSSLALPCATGQIICVRPPACPPRQSARLPACMSTSLPVRPPASPPACPPAYLRALVLGRQRLLLLALRASPVPSATPLHSMPPGQQGDHGLRLGRLPNELVSRLQLFAGLILTVVACVLAVIRFYVLDLVIPKVYSARTLEPLNDGQRRGFVNHHVAAGTKIFLIIITCYPLLAVLSGGATPQTPFAPGMRTTLGDVLVVSAQVFTAMYIFELFYREKISPIGCAHHVGAIVIAQTALAMNVNFDKEPDSIYELLLCFIWGTDHPSSPAFRAFDVVAELWPHVAMIVYRIHTPKHLLLARTFYATMALELVGTTVETAVVMWIFGSLWDRWSLSLKIATPILHTLFSAAQLWSARIFYKLAREQRTKHLYE
ncbi:hypothetical protein DCS_00014 [Drechmeria coniospora]|uniref:TLC domain-containing protein n=1 Tax=Drechmeria coniospora TaxID=98403 RepID=A0A151GP55_DRECN|nr:hypothetical protein DCS_00014 [Drechmeria coniospora]KYK58887.1 hypothetical protein DCS_00014 [Drechmeria coniospora]